MEWIRTSADILPFLRDPPPLIGGTDPEPIERIVSDGIYNNGGKRRPFKVAYDLLIKVVVSNAKDYYLAQREVPTETFEAFFWRIFNETNHTIFHCPEILCSLVLGDLNVPSSNHLLLDIINNWQPDEQGPLTFPTAVALFAAESVKAKKPKDPAPYYSVAVHWEDKSEDYCFVNFASFVALRWFLRYLWKDLDDVPSSWQEPPSPLLDSWIEFVMKTRERTTSLRNFASKMDKRVFSPVAEQRSPSGGQKLEEGQQDARALQKMKHRTLFRKRTPKKDTVAAPPPKLPPPPSKHLTADKNYFAVLQDEQHNG